jgi:ribonuclease HII
MNFKSTNNFLNGEKNNVVCGLDEAGRGPWAGPVVACALVLKNEPRIKGLKDSKQLSKEKRELAYKRLQKCSYFGVGIATHKEIDELGLIKAANHAFVRAITNLQKKHPEIKPDILLIDGRDKFIFPIKHKSIIKGDEKIKIIACASIIAKVERDKIMCEYAGLYPDYGFEKHKGYGTSQHQQAISRHGICDIHRKSYKPIVSSI